MKFNFSMKLSNGHFCQGLSLKFTLIDARQHVEGKRILPILLPT